MLKETLLTEKITTAIKNRKSKQTENAAKGNFRLLLIKKKKIS